MSVRNRVVITGLGAITPLGNSVRAYWDGLRAGRSGIRRISHFDPSEFPTQIGGEVHDFNPADYMDRKEARRTPRATQFALAVARQALNDAGLPETMTVPERSSVVFGTAIGGLDRMVDGIDIYRDKGQRFVNPFVLPSGLPNMGAYAIAKEFQMLGPNKTIATACATSTQTLGEGAEYIRYGKADIVITGGTEAILTDYGFAGFCAMRAMPTSFNDNPSAASRPFDAKREGFVFGEGAGAFVLESLDHALARGANIYAEVGGHASSADGYHMAAQDPSGKGPIRAVTWALEDAGVRPEEVHYVNTHGSSTPSNDPMETMVLKKVFGEHAYQLAVSSTKSMIGHPLGASGALEAMSCVMAIHEGCIAPTINYEYPDPDCDLDYVPNVARQAQVDVAISNSFGLGGQNATVVIKRYQP
jgi:beta-ketoacyl-acyl-carrier-protein synthase II